jgi:peptidoglycan/xylan/chitin deacetylase (PgdA/CDA1 family)
MQIDSKNGATVEFQRGIQQSIRSFHLRYFRRSLPTRLSIYLHSTAGCEKEFDELMSFIEDKGYRFGNPEEFLAAPGKICFISFDDNYRSWLRMLPILQKHRARATFYVNSWPFRDRVGGTEVRRYLNRLGRTNAGSSEETTLSTTELRDIASAGHLIGAHTHTHPVLSGISFTAACQEILICRDELGALLPQPPEHFAYPYGMRRHFSRSLRRYSRFVGFKTIANAIPCMQYARSRADNLYRSPWFLEQSLGFNLDNVCIDGRLFGLMTGRSAAGGNFL